MVLPLSLPEELSSLRLAGFLCFAANLFVYAVIGLRFFFGSYIEGWPDVMRGLQDMTTEELWFNTEKPAHILKALPIFTQVFTAPITAPMLCVFHDERCHS